MKSFADRIMHRLRLNLRNPVMQMLMVLKYYNLGDKRRKPYVVYMADGKCKHGGLTDRLNGIITLYTYCRQNNRPFKIYFNHPFKIEDFMPSNGYNYIITENELSYNIRFAAPRPMMNIPYNRFLKKLKSDDKQLHCYNNDDFVLDDAQWRDSFNQLFKPNQVLLNIVSEFKSEYGQWECVVFRFQNKLGDFKDGDSIPLNEWEKQQLILTCDSYIHKRMKSSKEKILICSDSRVYKEHIIALYPNRCFVYSLKNVHIDNTKESDFGIHLPAFADFFLLANALKITSVVAPGMYPSAFPKYAAKLNDTPFERIYLKYE